MVISKQQTLSEIISSTQNLYIKLDYLLSLDNEREAEQVASQYSFNIEKIINFKAQEYFDVEQKLAFFVQYIFEDLKDPEITLKCKNSILCDLKILIGLK